MSTKMTLGEEIKIKRQKLGLSARELAEFIGVRTENVYKWESGSKPSDPEIYQKVITWLKLDSGINSKESIAPSFDSSNDQKKILDTISILSRSNETLIRNNEKLIDTNNTIALTNDRISRTNELLANKLINISNSDEERATLQESVWMLVGMRDYLVELASEVKKQPPDQAAAALNKKVTQAKEMIGKMDSAVLSHK